MFPRDLVHHARHAFNSHTRPAFANTETTTVTDDPTAATTAMHTSTDSASTPSPTSTVTAADIPHAVVLYPTGQPTINNIDTVVVAYDTVWTSANLTLFCGIDAAANEWALAEIKLAEPSGTCIISPIQAGMEIPQFPVSCGMLWYNAMNVSDSTTGGGFTMTSTMGVVSTYGMTVTTAMSSSTTNLSMSTTTGSLTESSTGSSTGSTDESMSGSAPTTHLTATPAVSSSTASQTGVSAASSTTALSAGAKAGIAIGIILGAIALLAAIFFFFRLRKRINRVEDMVKLGSTASAEREPSSEKPITPLPGGNARLTSPAVFTMGGNLNRNSEDWRRFFGSASNPRSPTPTST